MEPIQSLLNAAIGNSAPSCEGQEDPMMALAKMRLDTVNALSEPPRGYDCPICRNKGYVAFLREEPMYRGSIVTRECQCVPYRRALRRMARSGMEDALRGCTFESFNAQADWQRRLKERAMGYAENPVGWLALLGQSGCGKTHLCTAVCAQLLRQGREVVYMSWRQEAARLKAGDLEERQRLLKSFCEAEVLYIDDLFKTGRDQNGAMVPTQADMNLAFTLLNSRYIGAKPTILSSELLMGELLELDEATAGRLLERCGANLCVINPDRGKNHRLNGFGRG